MARFNWDKKSGSGSSMHYGNINSYTNSDGKYTGKYTGGLSSNYKRKSKYDSLFYENVKPENKIGNTKPKQTVSNIKRKPSPKKTAKTGMKPQFDNTDLFESMFYMCFETDEIQFKRISETAYLSGTVRIRIPGGSIKGNIPEKMPVYYQKTDGALYKSFQCRFEKKGNDKVLFVGLPVEWRLKPKMQNRFEVISEIKTNYGVLKLYRRKHNDSVQTQKRQTGEQNGRVQSKGKIQKKRVDERVIYDEQRVRDFRVTEARKVVLQVFPNQDNKEDLDTTKLHTISVPIGERYSSKQLGEMSVMLIFTKGNRYKCSIDVNNVIEKSDEYTVSYRIISKLIISETDLIFTNSVPVYTYEDPGCGKVQIRIQ